MPAPDCKRPANPLRIAESADVRAARGAEALAHLLACLRGAAALVRECGADVDAYVIDAHCAALERGKEWPGDPIRDPFDPDGNPDPPEGVER